LKARLLRNFGSLKRVSEATFDELKPFVGTREAKRIVEHFAHIRDSELIRNDGAQLEN
jgi:ERCC4-type nuclease